MNHKMRVGLWLAKIYGYYIRSAGRLEVHVLYLRAIPLRIFCRLVVGRRLKKARNVVNDLSARTKPVVAELKAEGLAPGRKAQLLAACSALRKEHDGLEALFVELKAYRAPGTATFQLACTRARSRIDHQHRKFQSLAALVRRSDSGDFYAEVLLWFLVDTVYFDNLLGDLDEECLLLQSSDGPDSAKSWRRAQVTGALKENFWAKFERLAAIATVIDLVERWFRR